MRERTRQIISHYATQSCTLNCENVHKSVQEMRLHTYLYTHIPTALGGGVKWAKRKYYNNTKPPVQISIPGHAIKFALYFLVVFYKIICHSTEWVAWKVMNVVLEEMSEWIGFEGWMTIIYYFLPTWIWLDWTWRINNSPNCVYNSPGRRRHFMRIYIPQMCVLCANFIPLHKSARFISGLEQ